MTRRLIICICQRQQEISEVGNMAKSVSSNYDVHYGHDVFPVLLLVSTTFLVFCLVALISRVIHLFQLSNDLHHLNMASDGLRGDVVALSLYVRLKFSISKSPPATGDVCQ